MWIGTSMLCVNARSWSISRNGIVVLLSAYAQPLRDASESIFTRESNFSDMCETASSSDSNWCRAAYS